MYGPAFGPPPGHIWNVQRRVGPYMRDSNSVAARIQGAGLLLRRFRFAAGHNHRQIAGPLHPRHSNIFRDGKPSDSLSKSHLTARSQLPDLELSRCLAQIFPMHVWMKISLSVCSVCFKFAQVKGGELSTPELHSVHLDKTHGRPHHHNQVMAQEGGKGINEAIRGTAG